MTDLHSRDGALKAPLPVDKEKYGVSGCVTKLEIPYGIYKIYVLFGIRGNALKNKRFRKEKTKAGIMDSAGMSHHLIGVLSWIKP